LEVDDLLPLVDAADMLGFADTQEGDFILTQQGVRFAEAGVLEEKQIFRAQVLARVSILRQIIQELQKAPGHVLLEENIFSILQAHFGEEEAQAQLETAVNWGRYAELFTFQDERGIFRLEEAEVATKI